MLPPASLIILHNIMLSTAMNANFKENKALHSALILPVKKLGTLQESGNTQTTPTNTNIPLRHSQCH